MGPTNTSTPAYTPPVPQSGGTTGGNTAITAAYYPVNFPPPSTFSSSNPFSVIPRTINSSTLSPITPNPLPTGGSYAASPQPSLGGAIPTNQQASDIVMNSLSSNPVSAPPNHPGFDPNTYQPNPTPPPAPAPTPSAYDSTLARISGLNDRMATKGDVTAGLQNTYGLDQKTQDATTAYNNYQSANLAYQNKIAEMKLQSGGTTGGNAASISEASRIGTANLANLAVIAQAASGNLTAAQNIIKSKLDAQFEPIQTQIDNLSKYVSLNNANLSDSEKAAIQLRATQLQNNTDLLKSAMTAAHQFALQQGVTNPSVLAAIDAAKSPAEAYQAVGMAADGSSPSGGSNGSTLSGINPQYASYVTQTGDGTSYVGQEKLANLTPYQQQEAARQFAAANIQVLTPSDTLVIRNIGTTKQNLDSLSSLLVGTKKADGTYSEGVLGSGPVGRVGSSISNFVGGAIQSNPSIAAINGYSTLAINALQALGAGQNARITQTEINTQLKNIPTIYDSRETALKKIGILNSFLDNKSAQIIPKTNNKGDNRPGVGSLPVIQTKVGAINPNF